MAVKGLKGATKVGPMLTKAFKGLYSKQVKSGSKALNVGKGGFKPVDKKGIIPKIGKDGKPVPYGKFEKRPYGNYKNPEAIANSNVLKQGQAIKDVAATRKISPMRLALTGTAIGGLGSMEREGSLPFSVSEKGEDARTQKNLQNITSTKATLDKTKKEQDDAAKIVADNEATLQAEQDRVANMSFFDRWKAGMKDPTTAALFGAGLSDIGSNQPGQNSLAELQAGMAKTSGTAGAKQSKAEFDATAISEATLIKRFMTSPSMLKLRGDSDTARTARASGMAIKYKSMRAQMFALGMPTHYEAVMEMLEKQALEIERRKQGA
jgi:hypothetical protein